MVEELKNGSNDDLEHIRKMEDDVRRAELQAHRLESDFSDLNARIKELENRVSAGGESCTLAELLELARQQEKQNRVLRELEHKKIAKDAEHEAELKRIQKEDLKKRRNSFERDYADYLEILNNRYVGQAIKQKAWKTICSAWGINSVRRKPWYLVWNNKKNAPVVTNTRVVDLGGGVNLDLVWIPPGSFIMGTKGWPWAVRKNERSAHSVTLTKGFWMGKYAVTQRQWMQVMGNNPSHFDRVGPDAPVEKVSWDDCMEFIATLNGNGDSEHSSSCGFRLPSEAEWEYACRAGSQTRYFWGDDFGVGHCNAENNTAAHVENDVAFYDDRQCMYFAEKGMLADSTMVVGQFKPNAFGLYDMLGNVWEWCQDWYEEKYYKKSPASDPQGPALGTCRVRRGGSWDYGAGSCRSAARDKFGPSRRDFVGLRLVWTAE